MYAMQTRPRNKLMKYLCVIEYFFEEAPGGSGRVAWDIAQEMQRLGHEVTILFYWREGQPEGRSDYNGINLVRVKKQQRPSWDPRRLQAIFDSAEDACKQWLCDEQWDVVHIHTPLLGLGVMSALGAGPKYAVTVHSPIMMEQEIIWRNQGFAGQLKLLLGRRQLVNAERELLQSATTIHTLSQYTRGIIDEAYSVGDKVNVIPHWYERDVNQSSKTQARASLAWPSDAKIFVTVRGLGPRYGIDVAIKALAPIVKEENSNCYFYIGGRGPQREYLESLVAELGVEDKVKFLGRLSDDDLEAAYRAADVFILPTLALECYGLITVEAISFGCPVISTDAAAIPEIMRPILPDCIVPAGDVDALREKAKAFLAGSLGIPSREGLMSYARDHYARDAVAPKLIQFIES